MHGLHRAQPHGRPKLGSRKPCSSVQADDLYAPRASDMKRGNSNMFHDTFAETRAHELRWLLFIISPLLSLPAAQSQGGSHDPGPRPAPQCAALRRGLQGQECVSAWAGRAAIGPANVFILCKFAEERQPGRHEMRLWALPAH